MFDPRVPTSVLLASREERSAVALQPVDPRSPLPQGLVGHYFLVAPVGTLSTNGRRPYAGETTVMNGDGLVARIDFAGGQATLTSRIMRTPDYLADQLTQNEPDLELLRFVDSGIARIGLLGARDFLNTAFLPAWNGGGGTKELYLTYDSGRPYAVDPLTLDVRAPLGELSFWQTEAFGILPFPIVLSPAHPSFDPATSELWTVNYVRSLENVIFNSGGSGLHLPHFGLALTAAMRAAKRIGHVPSQRLIVKAARALAAHAVRSARPKVAEVRGASTPETATWVVRRDASGALAKVRLVTTTGDEVEIKQSVHQVAVTEKHFVLMDTAFKLGLPEIYNDPFPKDEVIEEIIRALFTRPQMPETIFWVVPRAAVDAAIADGTLTTVAQKVVVPVEATHFLADFDDAAGIVLHVGHSPATDLSEWVRPYDTNAYDAKPAPRVGGYLAVGPMDVGRLGRYVVDGATGQVKESKVLYDDQLTWSVALYAARDVGTEAPPPRKLEKLFWSTEGAYPELLTHFVRDLYEDYPHRITPVSEIEAMGQQGGRKSAILRIDTTRMEIEDKYVFEDGSMPSSLQVVGKPGTTDALDAWLIATIFSPTGTELWVWDARSLAAPISKLTLPEPSFGFSLHCAWLPSIAARALTPGERTTWRAELESRLRADEGHRKIAAALLDALELL